MASALVVTINQCNGSGQRRWSVDRLLMPAWSTTPSPAPPPPTGTASSGSSDNSTPLLPLLALLASGGLGLAVIAARRRRIYS